MAFRCRQRMDLATCTPVFEVQEKVLESGEYVQELADFGAKRLPDPELFDLGNQLKAGVQLDEVNSKVLGSKSVNADKLIKKFTAKKPSNSSDESEEL